MIVFVFMFFTRVQKKFSYWDNNKVILILTVQRFGQPCCFSIMLKHKNAENIKICTSATTLKTKLLNQFKPKIIEGIHTFVSSLNRKKQSKTKAMLLWCNCVQCNQTPINEKYNLAVIQNVSTWSQILA